MKSARWFLNFLRDTNSLSDSKNNLTDYRVWVFDKEEELTWVNHMTRERLRFLMSPGMKVFEYGSGQSTHFFKDSGASVWSIEDDLEWSEILKEEFQGFDIVKIRYVAPEIGLDEFDEEYSCSFGLHSINRSWKQYALTVLEYPDRFFDLIFLGGRARMSCLRHALEKLKSGGMLLLDNSDRQEYHLTLDKLLYNWKYESFQGVQFGSTRVSEARIYFKP